MRKLNWLLLLLVLALAGGCSKEAPPPPPPTHTPPVVSGEVRQFLVSYSKLQGELRKNVTAPYGEAEGFARQFFNSKVPIPDRIEHAKKVCELLDSVTTSLDGLSTAVAKLKCPEECSDIQYSFNNFCIAQKGETLLFHKLAEMCQEENPGKFPNFNQVSHDLQLAQGRRNDAQRQLTGCLGRYQGVDLNGH